MSKAEEIVLYIVSSMGLTMQEVMLFTFAERIAICRHIDATYKSRNNNDHGE